MTPESKSKVEEAAKAEFKTQFGLEVLGMANVAQTYEEREKQAVNRALAEVEARITVAALKQAIQDAAYGESAAGERKEK